MAKTKRDIDKELMYNKLMPSNLKGGHPRHSEEHGRVLPVAERRAATEQTSEQMDFAIVSTRRDISSMLLDSQPTVVTNRMERYVLEKLDSAMTEFHCCKCDRCKKDVFALALNKLSPKYAVLEAGKADEAEPALTAQALTAVIQAVLKVRKHPRH